MRLNGDTDSYSRRSASASSATSRNESVSGVSMIPGQTQLTRSPSAATSSASARVNWSSAPFEVVYGVSLFQAIERVDRGHVHDRAARGHVRHGGAADEKGPGDVHSHDALPLAVGRVDDARSVRELDARVVGHDVDPAEALDHALDALADRLGVRDVEREREGRLRLARDRLDVLRGARGHDDVRSLLREARTDGATDARPAAGDERDLPVQPHADRVQASATRQRAAATT
jgi:hypothetical protein